MHSVKSVLVESNQPKGEETSIKASNEESVMHIKNMPKASDKDSQVARKTLKISLKATKVPVRKTGMNSGITGGGYQCC